MKNSALTSLDGGDDGGFDAIRPEHADLQTMRRIAAEE